MVNLSKLEALALQLNEKERLAIAGLIDLKTEDDMDKVLNKLDAIESKFDAKFDAFDAKFDAVDAKFDAIKSDFDAKFDAVDAKFDAIKSDFDVKFDAVDAKFDAFDAKFDTLERRFSDFRWFIGGGFTLIGILITALKLY